MLRVFLLRGTILQFLQPHGVLYHYFTSVSNYFAKKIDNLLNNISLYYYYFFGGEGG